MREGIAVAPVLNHLQPPPLVHQSRPIIEVLKKKMILKLFFQIDLLMERGEEESDGVKIQKIWYKEVFFLKEIWYYV